MTISPALLCSAQSVLKSPSLRIFLANVEIMNKTQHGVRLLEELDLLQKSNRSSEPRIPRQVCCFWKWKGLGFLNEIRGRRTKCVVCLEVHCITNLPSSMDDRDLVVGWKTKGWKGELTLPVRACGGTACFDEIFLHYCNVNVNSTLRNFTIWVSSIEAIDCDFGSFIVDLSDLVSVENSNSMFGGKTVSFNLHGIAEGGTLSGNVYCRIIDDEFYKSHKSQQWRTEQVDAGYKQRKTICFPCLPDKKNPRNQLMISTQRISSLRSDHGFITIENSIENDYLVDFEDGGFITIEKEVVSSRSKRHPSNNSFNTDAEDGGDGDEDDRPCHFMGFNEEFDVGRVEDEFLKLLQEKEWKANDGEVSDTVASFGSGVEDNLSLDFSLNFDLNLDSLIKISESELKKANQVLKSRVEGALLEKEEYEELMKRWQSMKHSSSGSAGMFEFGSPI